LFQGMGSTMERTMDRTLPRRTEVVQSLPTEVTLQPAMLQPALLAARDGASLIVGDQLGEQLPFASPQEEGHMLVCSDPACEPGVSPDLSHASRAQATHRYVADAQKHNLRVFLEKLARRRRRIPCTAACHDSLRDSLHRLTPQASSSGCVPYETLKEILRHPPKNVPGALLRELVEVSRAYGNNADGLIRIDDLLSGAVEVEPGLLGRFLPALPVLSIFCWILVMPVVYCASTGASFVDGLYLGVMLTSTVGSSDVVPSTALLKLWATFYHAVGIALLVWMLVNAVNYIFLRHEAQILALLSPRDNADLLANDGHGISSGATPLEDLVIAEPAMAEHMAEAPQPPGQGSAPTLVAAAEKVPTEATAVEGATATASKKPLVLRQLCKPRLRISDWRPRNKVLALAAMICVLVVVGAMLAGLTSTEAGFFDVLYWSLLVCTATGAGDADFLLGNAIDPQASRALTLAFVFCSVSAFIAAVLTITEASLGLCSCRLASRLRSRSLPLDVLMDLDANGAGIGKLEFMCAGLMALDKVSAHDLWQVLDQFRRLDTNFSGELHAEHLAALRRESSDRARVARMEVPRNLDLQLRCGRPARQNLDFGEMSPVEPQLEPTVGSSLDRTARRHHLSVRFASSAGEASSTSHLHDRTLSPEQAAARQREPERLLGPDPLVQELYEDNLALRKLLEERDAHLIGQMMAQRSTEQALQQALAERQGLHGEMLLLQHVKAELEMRLKKEQKRSKDAENRCQELEVTRAAAERRCHEVEKRSAELERREREAQQQVANKQQLLDMAASRTRGLESQVKDMEQRCAEIMQKLQEAERGRLQADAAVGEARLRLAERDLHSQAEVQATLLQRQAFVQGGGQRVHGASAMPPTLPAGLRSWPWEAEACRPSADPSSLPAA